MKELNISDELLARYLDGQTSDEENSNILNQLAEDAESLDEFAAIAEAAKMADQEPLRKPDLAEAAKNISAALPVSQGLHDDIPKKRKTRFRLFIAAAAAVVTILIASTVYLVLRPAMNEDFLANQNTSTIDTLQSTARQSEPMVAVNKMTSSTETTTDNTRTQEMVKSEEAPSAQTNDSPSSPASNEYHTTQAIEKQYASKEEANSLTMKKPTKSSYAILCKNLDKSFVFEWTASNVQSLSFMIKDSQGKTIATITDPNISHYELQYRSLYPEEKVNWSLSVTYQDKSKEERNGQIQIDYKIQNQ